MVYRTGKSTYIVNEQRKEIFGGIFRDKVYKYKSIEGTLIGEKLLITLEDNKKIQTSPIQGYGYEKLLETPTEHDIEQEM